MVSMLVFAILGTMISTIIIGGGLYLLSNILPLILLNDHNPLDCLLFASLISAVDPVDALSVLVIKI